jgi:hypothetical protein
MQELESQSEQRACPARVFSLRSGKELDLLELESHMREIREGKQRNSDSAFGVEQTSVVVIEMRHYGDLPDGFAETVAQRAYDYAASHGVHMKGADAKASVSGQVTPARDA